MCLGVYKKTQSPHRVTLGSLGGVEGFKVWRVDAFLGIDGVFAFGDRDTSVFSTVAVSGVQFRYQEVLVIFSTVLTEANQKIIEVPLLYSFS